MLKSPALFVSIALASSASHADNCEPLRGQIEGKIKAAGVASFTVVVVDQAANAPGKVVGTCAKGAKNIVYAQKSGPASVAAASPAPTAPKPALPVKKPADTILTECKDGSVSVGGSCKK
jgi:hypothetical protein